MAASINEIIAPVERLNIPSEELIIVGGAALQAYGIKKTTDIDVVVTEPRLETIIQDWQWLEHHSFDQSRRGRLSNRGSQLIVERHGIGRVLEEGNYYERAVLGDISFMTSPRDHLYTASFDELMADSTPFGGKGIAVLSPQKVLEWKEAVNRPKDQKDIAGIRAYLAKLAS